MQQAKNQDNYNEWSKPQYISMLKKKKHTHNIIKKEEILRKANEFL